eukprot:m.288353 g.288353  ORF g.288353 m.288353 type:complete len:70 (-) comp15801_c1_seq10:259-468(-)
MSCSSMTQGISTSTQNKRPYMQHIDAPREMLKSSETTAEATAIHTTTTTYALGAIDQPATAFPYSESDK